MRTIVESHAAVFGSTAARFDPDWQEELKKRSRRADEMMVEAQDSVIAALLDAISRNPGDASLRRHVAGLLLSAGRHREAWDQAIQGLAARPNDLGLLECAIAAGTAAGLDVSALRRVAAETPARSAHTDEPAGTSPWAAPTSASRQDTFTTPPNEEISPKQPDDLGPVPDTADEVLAMWLDEPPPLEPAIGEMTTPDVVLNDVGGLTDVKQRLERSFLAPMRNPELRRTFGTSSTSGLVLWGPPGCGKTFLARALAGEIGAAFYDIRLSDVLDMWLGNSERNLAAIFEHARKNAPCVLFFDELDAIGMKRTSVAGNAMRGVINQLLVELDGATRRNDGVLLLAATNHPWDLDPALVRPGRFDRKLLVPPPDSQSRRRIFEVHLASRPTSGKIDARGLARATAGYSGADIRLICDDATENAFGLSVETGSIVRLTQAMLDHSVSTTSSSMGPWMETARHYATFANQDGELDDLVRYFKKSKKGG